jgi:hypothetical protein
MNCTAARHHLAALLYGDLPAPEQAAVEAHLAECPACRQEYAALEGVRRQLDRLPPPAAAVDLARLYQDAAQRQERRLRRWRRAALVAAAAAILLAIAAIGWRVEARMEPHQLVLRWGSPPAVPEATAPPAPVQPPAREVRPEPRPVALTQDQIQLLSQLIHALADDVQAVEQRQRQDASRFEVKLDTLQRKDVERWTTLQRSVNVALSLLTQKGE